MFDLQKMMKQAQQMQTRMQEVQDELAAIDVEGTAGGGAVTVVCNGKMEFKSIKISPDATGETEMLEDLILTALKDASDKSTKMTEEKMKAVTGGMNIPGMPKLPF